MEFYKIILLGRILFFCNYNYCIFSYNNIYLRQQKKHQPLAMADAR